MTTLLKHKGYTGSVDVSVEDKCLHGRVLFINDTITYEGDNVPEINEAFISAVDEYIETCQELGREPQKPFSGTFNVRISPDEHKKAAIYAKENGLTLNELVREAIKNHIDGNDKLVHHILHVEPATEKSTTFTINVSTENNPVWTTSQFSKMQH